MIFLSSLELTVFECVCFRVLGVSALFGCNFVVVCFRVYAVVSGVLYVSAAVSVSETSLTSATYRQLLSWRECKNP